VAGQERQQALLVPFFPDVYAQRIDVKQKTPFLFAVFFFFTSFSSFSVEFTSRVSFFLFLELHNITIVNNNNKEHCTYARRILRIAQKEKSVGSRVENVRFLKFLLTSFRLFFCLCVFLPLNRDFSSIYSPPFFLNLFLRVERSDCARRR
jgi:hypothetical protein